MDNIQTGQENLEPSHEEIRSTLSFRGKGLSDLQW